MKGKRVVVKTVAVLAILHPFEAMMAWRMALRRGRDPRLWALATLVFGVFALARLRALPPAE